MMLQFHLQSGHGSSHLCLYCPFPPVIDTQIQCTSLPPRKEFTCAHRSLLQDMHTYILVSPTLVYHRQDTLTAESACTLPLICATFTLQLSALPGPAAAQRCQRRHQAALAKASQTVRSILQRLASPLYSMSGRVFGYPSYRSLNTYSALRSLCTVALTVSSAPGAYLQSDPCRLSN